MSNRKVGGGRRPVALAAALLLATSAAFGAATTDGSMGVVQNLSGNFLVPQTLGQLRGNNLFHSFSRFSILNGESATFTTSAAGLKHVIARVTGGEVSTIDGRLRLVSANAAPDFWLLNPSGVMVGANASFDVPAGLHLSTAQQLRFADGSTWSTGSATDASTLSVAAPESFGFLSGQAAAPLKWQGANLFLNALSPLDLAGGSISLEGGLLVTPGGAITLRSPGAVTIAPGTAVIAGYAGSTAGSIAVDAASLTIDGGGLGGTAGLGVLLGGTATGGAIDIRLSGALQLLNGGGITSENNSFLDAAPVSVQAASLTVRRDSGAQTYLTSTSSDFGRAASLQVKLGGALTMVDGTVGSTSTGVGAAGNVSVTASSALLDGRGFGDTQLTSAGDAFGAAGRVDLSLSGSLTLRDGAYIRSRGLGLAPSAPMTISADRIDIDGGASGDGGIVSVSNNLARAADVTVTTTGAISITSGGQISTLTLGSGDGGHLAVKAGSIGLQGAPELTSGLYTQTSGSGRGGNLLIETGRLSAAGPSRVATDSNNGGDAGNLTVKADSLLFDARLGATTLHSFTGADGGSAGSVDVQVKNDMTVANGAWVFAGTTGTGNPGALSVKAGTLVIDGRQQGADQLTLVGLGSVGQGRSAPVDVQATRIDIRQGGVISSASLSTKDGGAVTVTADTITIDGGGNADIVTGIIADALGDGHSGSVTVRGKDLQISHAGRISTGSEGPGQGGVLDIDVQRLRLDGSGSIQSNTLGQGDAGAIRINASESLTLSSGGMISASTARAGRAGAIEITAGSLLIEGRDVAEDRPSFIASLATERSSGQTGDVSIKVKGDFVLRDGGAISVSNLAIVDDPSKLQPTALIVEAGNIIANKGEINAEATGNTSAGGIGLWSDGRISMTDTNVRTAAVSGDGGPIVLSAGGVITLRNTSVTTSVEGRSGGNGGDILVEGKALVLASGFVQANTAGQALGGNVTIDTGLLVPDGNSVFIGGQRIVEFQANRPGFNVIQAAAPQGLSGDLDVTLPDLNLASSLVLLATPHIDFGLLGRDLCQIGYDSSFTLLGRGALPAPVSAPLRADPDPAATPSTLSPRSSR